jgi:hypothetical protein
MKAGPSTPRGVSARRCRLHPSVAVALAALTTVAALALPGPAAAATCAAGELVPQVRGYSINQGLSSYKDLVRGKDLVFRLFLSRPTCAEGTTQSVSLTGASLAVKAGAATVLTLQTPTNNLNPPPLLAYHSQAPALPDSTGDPKWLISGQALSAAAPAAATPLTFEATLKYSNSAGASNVTLPVTGFGGQAMQKTLLAPTLPLRVLAIPLGRGTQTVSSQFSAGARTATLDGLSVLGRIFPVANGTADLTTSETDLTTGGVRYHLNTNTLVDVSGYMSSGLFCDDGTALRKQIGPQLLDNLKQYNTANPLSKSADNVMGVVDQAVSSNNCGEGFAIVNSKVSYVRARYGTSPAMTGALMGMEQAHNFGAVPCGGTTATTTVAQCPVDRDARFDAYHAQNTWAHSSAASDYPDVAYNLLSPTATGQPVADDRNVMRFAGQPAGTWLNANTFLQKEDWALLICKLGGPATNDCVLPTDPSAATAGAAARPTTTIVGTTDGTKGGTQVFDSFADQPGAVDLARASHIHLVQRNAANGVVQDDPVLLTDHGNEGHHSVSGPHDHSKVFSVSYATHPDAAALELVNTQTGEVLYRRSKSGGGPRNVHTTVTMTGGTSGGCTTDCPPPSEMAGPGGFGPAARKIDFETNPATGQPYQAGDTVTTQYLLSHGLSFNDDPTTTPKILGDCASLDEPCRFPPGTGTQSGRFSLWNSPDTLPVGPVDPVPNSAGIPLTVNFVQPVQRVAVHIGNDDTSSTTATLTAFDPGGQEIKTVTRQNFGPASTNFVGIDAGRANIAGIELDYGQSPLGEEIDDLVIERPAGGTTTNTYRAVVTAEDDEPSNMRAAFFAKCPASNEILVGGVRPVSINGDQATFHHDFDATQICRNGSTTTILVRFNDGYNQTSFYELAVNAASTGDLRAVIDNPAAEASAYSVLQHEPITLSGQGWDAQEGVLPGSNLRWTVTGPSGVVADGVSGNSVTLPAPAAGWVPGSYTAKLRVTNSAGSSADTSSTFRVLEDKDNDGIEVTAEGCFRGSDNDPNDAFGDFDNDGIPNAQDEDRCSPRTAYEGFADFDPNTLNYPSNGGSTSVTVKVALRYRDLRQVNGSTVRIATLAGAAVPDSASFRATAWNVSTSGGVVQATAKFDRQAIIDFLCPSSASCHTNQTVSITVTGEAPRSGSSPAFTFRANDSFAVQKG